MIANENYLGERPTFTYVKALAMQDSDWLQKFLVKLKQSFANDIITYRFHMEMDEPRTAAEAVSKLMDTLIYLGMDEAYIYAERHREKLQSGNVSMHSKFQQILITIKNFLIDT